MDILHIQAQAVCIALLLVLYRFDKRREDFNCFKKIYFFSACACVAEILKRVICTDNRTVIHIFNLMYHLCICFCVLNMALSYKKRSCACKKKDVIFIVINVLSAVAITVLQAVFFSQMFSVIPYLVFVTLFVLFAKSQHTKITVDNLTKLKNRYGMDEEIQEQLEQYARDKNDSFYVIACDMNDFKSINDTWGHNEGDRALRMVGAVLDKVCSDFDAEAFRTGGDEFIIITNTSEPNLANKVCLAVKTQMSKINFREDYQIKISMGVALYDGTKTITELIENADNKLYWDKQESKKHPV